MGVDKLKVNDPRVEHHTAVLNGHSYHYMLGRPADGAAHRATVLLTHGFPDLGFTWRYQVPMLQDLGLQVIVPDLIGYGGSDAPEELAPYTHRRVCADLAELCARVCPGEQVILGGHDWGGIIPWRMPLWHPGLARALFSITLPYYPPTPQPVDLDDLVRLLPNLGYQRQFRDTALQRALEAGGAPATRRFLDAVHQMGPQDVLGGFDLDALASPDAAIIPPARSFDDDERAFYVEQFRRRGWTGPFNWYRTRRHNWEEELALLDGDGGVAPIALPTLFIGAAKDSALPPAMWSSMDRHFTSLRRAEVGGGHWSMWTRAEQVNALLREFILEVLAAGTLKASL